VRVVFLSRGAEPQRFLKQARHRVSRRFLKDGARSSLPQYLQTNFSARDPARDDCCGRRETFVVFAA